MIHASYYRPRIYPINGNVVSSEIDRAQSIDPSMNLNRERIDEIGRVDAVGYVKNPPSLTYTLRQFEYGGFEFWRKVTNKADSVTDITLEDFKIAKFDIAAYLTDDDGTFKGTLVYPKMRTSGFSININDPQSVIERSFNFVGEQTRIIQGTNAYYINLNDSSCVGTGHTIQIGNSGGLYDNYPTPVENPNTAGSYIDRVMRVRAGVSTEILPNLISGGYYYNSGTTTITFPDSAAGDIYKVWYTAASYITGENPFTNNDTDEPAILADSCDIFLYVPASGEAPTSSNYCYRLQSVSVDVTFDRADYREIGNRNIVVFGVNQATVKVTLGRFVETFTIEEVLAGKAANWAEINGDLFTDTSALVVKFYTDYTKTTFKWGFKCTGMSPTDVNNKAAVKTYTSLDDSLEGTNMTLTTDEGDLG